MEKETVQRNGQDGMNVSNAFYEHRQLRNRVIEPTDRPNDGNRQKKRERPRRQTQSVNEIKGPELLKMLAGEARVSGWVGGIRWKMHFIETKRERYRIQRKRDKKETKQTNKKKNKDDKRKRSTQKRVRVIISKL